MSTWRRVRRAARKEAVDDFVVEEHADHVLANFKTQKEAIEWARQHNHLLWLPASGTSTIRKPLTTGVPPRLRGT
jgi:hypothetical protein